MPIFNLTISDVSPVITYRGAWGDSSHDDPKFNFYSNGTFHATKEMDASATIRFNGTGVYLKGAFRANHEQYRVTLDGMPVLGNGSANPDLFDQLMFGQDNLPFGEHEITLANDYTTPEPSYVDLDYVIITTGDGNTKTTLNEIAIDDTVANYTYSQGWSDVINDVTPQYFAQTQHHTNLGGASVNISFWGNNIKVFGATSNNHGQFSVALDGGPPIVYDGHTTFFLPQQLLYFTSNLNSGPHVVTLTNLGTNDQTFFDVDAAVVGTYDSPPALPRAPKGPNTAAYVGGAAAGIVVLIVLIGLVVFLLLRRGRTKHDAESGPKPKALPNKISPFLERTASDGASSRAPGTRSISSSSIRHSNGSSFVSGTHGLLDHDDDDMPPMMYAQPDPGPGVTQMSLAIPAAAVLANAGRHSYVPTRDSYGAPSGSEEGAVQRERREKEDMIEWEMMHDDASLRNPHSPSLASPVYSLFPQTVGGLSAHASMARASSIGPGGALMDPGRPPPMRQLTVPSRDDLEAQRPPKLSNYF